MKRNTATTTYVSQETEVDLSTHIYIPLRFCPLSLSLSVKRKLIKVLVGKMYPELFPFKKKKCMKGENSIF